MTDWDELIDEVVCEAKNLFYDDAPLNEAVSALRAAIDAVENKNKELREILNGNAKLAINTIFGANKADIVAKHPIFGLFIDSIMEIFLEQDAKNFIGVNVGNAEIGHFIVTVQKKDGKSPYERWIDAESRVAALEAQLKGADADADRLANAGWNPPEYTENYGDVVCRFCEQGGYAIPIVHKPDCPWVLHQKRKEGK